MNKKERMNLIKEWIEWKLFRPKGAFRGWWNMTEEEIREKSQKDIYNTFDKIVDIFVKNKWLLNSDFLKVLLEEIKRMSRESVEIELQVKREQELK